MLFSIATLEALFSYIFPKFKELFLDSYYAALVPSGYKECNFVMFSMSLIYTHFKDFNIWLSHHLLPSSCHNLGRIQFHWLFVGVLHRQLKRSRMQPATSPFKSSLSSLLSILMTSNATIPSSKLEEPFKFNLCISHIKLFTKFAYFFNKCMYDAFL